MSTALGVTARATARVAARSGVIVVLAGLGFAAHARAQVRPPQPARAEISRLEAALAANPLNRNARKALLDYYFTGAANPALAVPARRRLILWLIENAPGDELAGGPSATIDASGHSLADPQGFKLASAAWSAQVAKPGASAAALANAAYFFKLSDKEFTIQLLERALALDPASKETAARLGDEYALAIMGVTMVNKNGYPLGVDPGLTKSRAAARARQMLETSQNPFVLAKAGYMLLWQGAILFYSRQLAFDTDPLAKAALDRAVSLAPNDPGVQGYRAQYDEIHREYRRAAPKPPIVLAGTTPAAASAATVASPLPPPPATPPQPEVTAADLHKVAAGMTREALLKFGPPAGRLAMDEDGGLVEIFQYSSQGAHVGTVRLKDGVVTGVKVP